MGVLGLLSCYLDSAELENIGHSLIGHLGNLWLKMIASWVLPLGVDLFNNSKLSCVTIAGRQQLSPEAI